MYNILIEKILTKAKENGFSYTYLFSDMLPCDEGDLIQYDNDYDMFAECGILINSIIFSHEFAKAFWGEELVDIKKGGNKVFHGSCDWGILEYNNDLIKCWEYHLMQMILQENKIKYLEKFIKE